MLRRTKEPGVFYDDLTGKLVKIIEWRVDDRYDTAAKASGAVVAGAGHNFFRDLVGSGTKEANDGNFPTVKRIVGTGEEMIVERLWAYMPSAFGNTVQLPRDFKKAMDGLYLLWKINRDPVSEGFGMKYPSGYGPAGQTTENDAGVISNGVPSTAAAAKLSRTYDIGKDTEVDVAGTWYDHTWDATNMPTLAQKIHYRVGFHGLIKTAATRAG